MSKLVSALCGLFAGAVALAAPTLPARADHQPVIAMPGRRAVPVLINGYDASCAVVYGDVGLYRGGHIAPIIEGPAGCTDPADAGGYYPRNGRAPRLGRFEIDRPRDRKPVAPDYRRSWSTQPQPGPVTEYPPFDPPPVILAPRDKH